MDIVLGVSMTPTTVRMVLVEGEKADGVTVDHDIFDVNATDGSATSSAADQVVAAMLGTQESAAAGGHHLKSIGVTWTHHSDAAELRDALAARGIEDVMLVSGLHAAGALAQAVGRAVGYDTTALLFIERDTATLSVVQTDDGSVVKVLSRDLHGSDAMAVLAEMARPSNPPDRRRRACSSSAPASTSARSRTTWRTWWPCPSARPRSPSWPWPAERRLRRRMRRKFEATTAGLAYSQDPEGTTAGSDYPELAAAATQLAPVDAGAPGSPPTQTRSPIPTTSRSRS